MVVNDFLIFDIKHRYKGYMKWGALIVSGMNIERLKIIFLIFPS